MSESTRVVLRLPPATAVPAIGWFFLFLVIPLAIVFLYSLATKGLYGAVEFKWTSQNYVRATEWIYVRILLTSIKLAFTTTVLCLLVGYPMAYVMATASAFWRSFLLILVIVPFWTNLVVRAYAIKLLVLGTFPIEFMNSAFAVLLGMVASYLPYMVLPLYVSIEKFDFSLAEAAKDLGASPINVFYRVMLPMTRPGVITGSILVFTPALGEFVIPDLLGGAKTMLIGNLITEQFLKTRDWPFGSALSLILIGTVMVSLIVYLRIEGRESSERVVH